MNEICCCDWTWAIYGSHFEWLNLDGQLHYWYLLFSYILASCIYILFARQCGFLAPIWTAFMIKTHSFSVSKMFQRLFTTFSTKKNENRPHLSVSKLKIFEASSICIALFGGRLSSAKSERSFFQIKALKWVIWGNCLTLNWSR